MISQRAIALCRTEEEPAWTTTVIPNTPAANAAAQTNPEAGLVPAARLPAQGGAAPLPDETIMTTRNLRVLHPREIPMTDTSAPHRAAETHPPDKAAMTVVRLHNEAACLLSGAARPPVNTADMNAAVRPNPDRVRRAATLTALRAPARPSVPAAAGDTVPPARPADLPAARARKRRSAACGFSRARSLSSPSRLLRSR